jgi:MoaA/NifB/PqqE/SkfB family radical SAM enzyme
MTTDITKKAIQDTRRVSYDNFDGKMNNLRDTVYDILGDPERFKDFHEKDVFIWLTNQCNSTCKYCYQSGSDKGGGITYDHALGIIDLFRDHGYYVHPIVNEWLPEYWNYLALLKLCGIRQISTNGIVVAQQHREFFPLLKENRIEDVRVTLFPEKNHTFYTNRSREISLDAIRLLKENGFKVVANFLVSRDTFPHMKEVVAEAKQLGVDEVFFQNFIYTGRAKAFRHAILTPEEIDHFWQVYHEIGEAYAATPVTINVQGNFGPNPIGDNPFKRAARHGHYCLAGSWKHMDHLYVSHELEIYPCVMMADPRFKIGDVIREQEKWVCRFDDVTGWEKRIPGFDRSTCGALMDMQNQLSQKQMIPDGASLRNNGPGSPTL